MSNGKKDWEVKISGSIPYESWVTPAEKNEQKWRFVDSLVPPWIIDIQMSFVESF